MGTQLITSISVFLLFFSAYSPDDASGEKINGVSFMGNPRRIDERAINHLTALGSNEITLMPFAYGQSGSSDLIWKDLKWQWWGESSQGTEETILLAQDAGLDVMIKPQIWFDHGSFTGHFSLPSDEEWKTFEAAYSDYILHYARMSEKHGLKRFCIGTELCRFVEERPLYWKTLIDSIRTCYSGQLVYAANWDTYDDFALWNELDYIGVDAYFPLSESKTPTVRELVVGWTPHVLQMKNISEKHRKPVVFTEWGYRSMDFCASKPWEVGHGDDVNLKGQANAYKAFYIAMYSQPWFAGGYVWKWHPEHEQAGGEKNNRFTPQNKPAEETLRQLFHASK